MAANKFAGNCTVCRTTVAVGAGQLAKSPEGKWVTTHNQCGAPAVATKTCSCGKAIKGRWSLCYGCSQAFRASEAAYEEKHKLYPVTMQDGTVIHVNADDYYDATRDAGYSSYRNRNRR